MKKFIIVPIALSLLAFALTGCGEGEEAVFGNGDSNNSLQISRFNSSGQAIARIDTQYQKSARDIQKTNIVGNDTQISDDLPSSTVLANDFEGTLEDRYIDVNGRTVSRPIYEKNSNTQVDYQTTYRTLNLSGVTATDYAAGNTLANSRGIFTDLNTFTRLPRNLSFPAGSVCYIPVVTSARSFFVFNDKNKTGYTELNKWTLATEKRFSDNRASRTTTVKVGADNSQQAAQVKFFAVNNAPEYIYNGVDYNTAIYEAHYVASGTHKPNENSLRAVVECTLVNEVAADFLEREIKKVY